MELHAIVVHFAIGLTLISVFFDLIGTLLNRDSLKDAGLWTITLGAIAVVVAAITGIAEAKELSKEGAIIPEVVSYLKTHRNIGLLLLLLVPILAGLRIFVHVKKNKTLQFVYLGIAILVALVIAYQGNLGGKLVYKFGLGTPVIKIK